MNNNQSIINQKVRDFIKRYYLNKLYKGALFFVLITLLCFIIYSLLEYFSYFNSTVRSVLFYSYIALFTVTFVFYILIPLLKIFGLGKQLTNEQIADIIGRHFPEIDDKLLNVFQLENMIKNGDFKSYDLINTAIDVKIEKIKPFSFVKAIPFKKTTKYIRWAAIPVLLFIFIFSFKSEVFTDSTTRIVNYNQVYEKPAPYHFEITNKNLTAFQHDDFTVTFKVGGEEIPQDVYISFGKKNFKCVHIDNTNFSYTFTNLQQDIDFQIFTEEVASTIYTLSVLPKPVTIGFAMQLNYPAYLNKNSEIIDNNGNATVPEGTRISWKFYTKNTDSLVFIYQNHVSLLSSGDGNFAFSVMAKASFDYELFNMNRYYVSKDTMRYTIDIIKDMYPEIFIESQRDSIYADRYYFKGNIKDDYGFSSLQFVYTKYDDKDNELETNKIVPITIQKQNCIQDFYFYFDAPMFDLKPGYKLSYYFQVFDNDGVNGFKSTKSNVFNYKVKTLEEVNKEIDKAGAESKDKMNDLIKESAQLMKDIDKLNTQLLQTNNPSWQEKKKLEALLSKFNELKKQMQELEAQQDAQKNIENQYKDLSEEILEKQEELQRRMENVLSDEMKQMLEKMQKMMQEMNKDQMQDAVKKMKMEAKDINQSLDQQLQLFKQLEFDKKLAEVVKQAKDIATQQRALSEQTKKKEINKNSLLQQQQDVENQYNKFKEDVKALEELNKQLEEPNKMSNTEEQKKEIEQKLNSAKENLGKNNREKAAENQNDAADKLDDLAEKMEQDQNESKLEEITEDIATLRQILDNLVQISFNQEGILVKTKGTSQRSPSVSELITNQHTIVDNMKMLDDSLLALARRQTAVKPFIQKEVTKIRDYLESAQNNLSDRQMNNAATNEQFILTSMNNLSLMLAESMKEMKQKQSECKSNCKKSGNGSCSKPGGKGKSKKQSAREMQQQLNRQMEAMQKSLQQGKKQGDSKEQQSMSEQFARMAAQQEAIRKMMQDYQNQMKSQNGVGDKSLEQLLQEMEKTEKELVNKQLSQQTILRQQNIETRLLESERAEMEKEKEKKRESTEAIEKRRVNPPKDWSFDKEKEKQTEMLKTVPTNLNYYYKEKVNNYFYNIQ